MEIEVQKHIEIEDGKHSGEITRVEYREEPFRYTDVFVKVDEAGFEIKYGCPTILSEKTKLGKLLSKFTELKPGPKLDPAKVLVGKRVAFVTVTEDTDNGRFARIADNSIKPI